MARRYVNPNHRAVPDSPENFAGELFDLARSGHVGEEQGRKLIRAYTALMAGDREIRGQLGGQLRLRPPAVQQAVAGRTAVEALYRPDAPGAALNGAFADIGEFALAVKNRSPKLDQVYRVQNSFGAEVPDAGGALIPEDLRSDLMLLSLESSVVRPRALVFSSQTLRIGVPAIDDTTHASSILGGVTSYWTEEATAPTEVQASYERIFLDSKKQLTYSTAPNELMADAPVFGVYLRETLPAAIAWWQDKAFFNGTGWRSRRGGRTRRV
jgi:HK97 family phage major capsid protein